MPCFRPRKGWYGKVAGSTGKLPLVFNRSEALNVDHELKLPCNACLGCRRDRQAQWALRAYHEGQMHERKCALTLTYDDDHLPSDWSVNVKHLQDFNHRLRKYLDRSHGLKMRLAGCGEYGAKHSRPHYHELVYGFDFRDDRVFERKSRGGTPLFSSPALTDLWGQGDALIGKADYAACAYVMGYCVEKYDKALREPYDAERHGSTIDADGVVQRGEPRRRVLVHPVTGQELLVAPEFFVSSRRPGLGAPWFDKFKDDAFSFARTDKGRVVEVSDFLVQDGHRVSVPSYYFRRFSADAPADAEAISRSRKRKAAAPSRKWNSTPARLKVREEIAVDRAKRRREGLIR